jgi:hypothetical protein
MPAFQLYSRWAPEAVRSVEAMTLREWQAARERVSPARGTSQRVLEEEGRIVGWVRLASSGDLGRFDVMADPSCPGLEGRLADAAIARLRERKTLLSLVPEFAGGLMAYLGGRGFNSRGEYVVLAKRTMRPLEVTEPELAAATTA